MRVAIIVPCLNEEHGITSVVKSCREVLPEAEVHVIDNGSTDLTAERARAAGAIVHHSPTRGKGNALRHAFREVKADYYVMIDGDGTYPMTEVPRLLDLAQSLKLDMVTGSRLELGERQAFRRFHLLGNRMFSWWASRLFRTTIHDLLTGLRVFSDHFVKNLDIHSTGFELETELTLRAIGENFPILETQIPYTERAKGSKSKLRTFRDGWIILRTTWRYWRHYRSTLAAKVSAEDSKLKRAG